MRLLVDLSLILIIFLFSYAFGRKSESDGEHVIPLTVTLFTLFLIVGIYIIINLPSIFEVMSRYSNR